ncbi:ribosome small subunit-dependent GTPase A [Candidatus Ferrigenium straubiae]|uniref:ribosome small subunit-dependent GTPase A n=1 Tax=Candidatus Ferrigenium straubiae TaxID=2919506 RepID=UPI003F4A95CD
MNTALTGRVVAAFGRQYLVHLDDGSEMLCLTRGKKSEVVCGDIVEIKLTGEASAESGAQGVIERIAPRRSLLHRSDAFREKLIAANVTQIIVVVAAEPSFSDELLARCLVAAHDQKLDTLIVLNKCDLAGAAAAARERLAPYGAIGYRVLELSAKLDVSALRPFLQGHTSVLVGQSGMGKSTLINALLPEAQAATREISSALDSGKHTTTHARLYRLDESSSLIDCPGVQAFGLHHLSFGGIEQGFVEFAQYLGQCRFHDCRHTHEPSCALREAAAAGKIDARRLELFQQISRAN